MFDDTCRLRTGYHLLRTGLDAPGTQDYIQHKLMAEIELGQFHNETRHGLLSIVKRMVDEDLIQGLILGGTELPLILTEDEFGIPFLNTTKIHVESVIRYCLTGN